MANYYNLSGSFDQYKRKDWYNQFSILDVWQFDNAVIVNDSSLPNMMSRHPIEVILSERKLHYIDLDSLINSFAKSPENLQEVGKDSAIIWTIEEGPNTETLINGATLIQNLKSFGFNGKCFLQIEAEILRTSSKYFSPLKGFWWLWATNEPIEVNNQEKDYKLIDESIAGLEIREIKKETEYYFQKAQLLIQDLLSFDKLSTDQIIKHQTKFSQQKITFSEYYQGLKPESADEEFFKIIGTLVSYIDVKGYNKYIWNEYDPPRSLAYTGVNQTNIVKNLLIFRILGLSEVKSINVKRALGQLIDPIGKVHVISDRHRKLILKNLLKEETPDLKLFYAKLYRYFQKEIKTLRNPINASVLIARIVYSQQVKALWQLEEPLDIGEEEEESPEEKSTEHIYPGYDADKDKGDDLLDIRDDYVALATLIGFQKLRPPLAIGLFGNWGSGKSFFMEKLYSEIEWLKEKEKIRGGDDYCTRIVQVRFNAWHYSDTNLWASLIRTIFHALKVEGEKQGRKKNIEEILYERITSSKKAIQLARERLEKARAKRDKAQSNLKVKSERRVKFEGLLKGIGSEIFLKELEEDPDFQEQVSNIKEAWGVNADSDQGLSEILQEGLSFPKRVKKAIWKKESIRWLLGSGAIVLLLLLLPDKWNPVSQFKNFSTALITFLTPYLLIGVHWYNKLGKPLRNIRDVSGEYLQSYKASWQAEKDILDAEVESAMEGLKSAQIEAEQDEKAIKEIKVGKHFFDFVEHKADLYEAELGLISTIRKDLDSLQRELDKVEKKEENFWIDRIVLYIDDLDRCPEKKVVEVLQAIHLLLAVDKLFVAVVGVDPRWVSKAIESQYQELLDAGNNKSAVKPATSFDYLEKIFQIPIALKPVSDDGAKKMMKNLLLSPVEITQKEEESNGHFNTSPETRGSQSDSARTKSTIMGGPVIEDDQLEIKKLEISKNEKEFMEFFAPLVGNTPRTVKRYINLYRLVKSHKDVPDQMVGNSKELHGIICLLAIVVAYPKCAQLVLEEALKSNAESLYNFVKALDGTSSGIKKLQNDFLGLADKQKDNEFWELIRDMEMSNLTKHIGHISKFSFRTLELDVDIQG